MPMPVPVQRTFADPEFICPDCLEPGTLAWLLARHPPMYCPDWLMESWERRGLPGRDPRPARALLACCLLRRHAGISRRRAARQACTNAEWRAAMGMSWLDSPPDEAALRRFERFLRREDPSSGLGYYELLHDHVVRACLSAGLGGPEAVWVMDSTPMLCFGAVMDTINLLGSGVRYLVREWANATGRDIASVAEEWDAPVVVAKSTKGHFRIDWSDGEARAEATDALVGMAVRVCEGIWTCLAAVAPERRQDLLQWCFFVAKIVSDDLEEDGHDRMVVARRVASGRLVSLTDPEARHGRKSRSKTFNGFKLHVLGDAVIGLIASVEVTAGDVHDSRPAPLLLAKAQTLVSNLDRVLADHAYGAVGLVKETLDELGIDLFAPPMTLPKKDPDTITKQDFAIDFEAQTATCPAGVTTDDRRTTRLQRNGGKECMVFKWPKEACIGCPLAERCMGASRVGRSAGRRLELHPLEEELRSHRARWQHPDVREDYRRRSEGERLIALMVGHGCRSADTWGLDRARQQAHEVATSCNLSALAKVLGAEEREAWSRRHPKAPPPRPRPRKRPTVAGTSQLPLPIVNAGPTSA